LLTSHSRQCAIQSGLARARSLETAVALAAGAAHELNNPLTVISGRAQMLRSQPIPEETQKQLEAISRQAHAASDIVTELMEFARPRTPVPQSVSLRDVMAGLSAELLATGLLAEGQLRMEIPSDTPPVWFDREYLQRLFRELLLNAIEATPAETRSLAVKARSDSTEENLVVQVIDNGRGMTTEVLGRAMDPFYSWRPAGRGRGLGLSRVSRWLAEGGGSVFLESRPGVGTRVEVRLPTPSPTGS
jgi:signal transduction histidine kinase